MKRKVLVLLIMIFAIALSACSAAANTASTGESVAALANQNTLETTGQVVSAGTESITTAEISSQNQETHEADSDYVWDAASAVSITFNGDSISSDNSNVSINGSTVTIAAAGTYILSGQLTDGQIAVDTQDEEAVRLILNGVDISNSSTSPVYIANAKKVVIVLADGTDNKITDAPAYVSANTDENEPNAALLSKSDLTIFGDGSLTVNGNYNDGISSKDGLIIASGVITVNAVDDGIRGKDYLVIKDGNLSITAQGDGLKSDNDVDSSRGYISISGGILNINAGNDAISAQTDVLISGGAFTLTTANGSSSALNESISAKGIKGTVSVSIDTGTFFINSADDSIHSNGDITINGGTFDISSGDDGIHADTSLTINNGEFNITDCYEGIESALIALNNGTFHIIASDDGINVAGGMDSSGIGQGMNPGGGPGQDAFSSNSGSNYLYINGGYIYVDANGDGIDVNGAIQMTNGTVIVNGPTENMNGALDYDRGFTISGGTLVAAGSAGMAMAPDQSSSQNSVLINFTSVLQAGTLVHIQNSSGEEILSFAPTKAYQSLVLSSPALVNGTTYEIDLNGNSSGSLEDGIYTGGTYSTGSQYDTFTVSSVVTQVGSAGGMGGQRGGAGGPGRGGGNRP